MKRPRGLPGKEGLRVDQHEISGGEREKTTSTRPMSRTLVTIRGRRGEEGER